MYFAPHVNQFGYSDRVLEAFTEGDCWALAEAIRFRTMWDVIAVGFEGDQYLGFQRDWLHVAILTPDDMVLDIEGIHTRKDFLDRWGGDIPDALIFTANDLRYTALSSRCFPEVDVHKFAEQIISYADGSISPRVLVSA